MTPREEMQSVIRKYRNLAADCCIQAIREDNPTGDLTNELVEAQLSVARLDTVTELIEKFSRLFDRIFMERMDQLPGAEISAEYRCPFCGSGENSSAASWSAEAEGVAESPTNLQEHQCHRCGKSFWVANDSNY